MKKVLFFATVFVLQAGTAFADHCWNGGEIAMSADRLSDEAHHLTGMMEGDYDLSRLMGFTQNLADRAEHVARMAQDGYACEHIRQDFQETEEVYRQLRGALDDSCRYNSHIRQDFYELEHALFALRNAIYNGGGNHYPGRNPGGWGRHYRFPGYHN